MVEIAHYKVSIDQCCNKMYKDEREVFIHPYIRNVVPFTYII